MLPANTVGDDVNVPLGREGRGFQSPFGESLQGHIHIHERRPRAYARKGKNNADVISRPSRPSRSRAAIADLHSAHSGASRTHLWRCHRQDPVVIVHRLSPAAEIAKRAL
jgi:hypothetical protein